jgi:pyridoxine 5-phosphate synthase
MQEADLFQIYFLLPSGFNPSVDKELLCIHVQTKDILHIAMLGIYGPLFIINLILEVKPEQVTLVPDPPDVLTSNAGWDVVKNADMLKEVVTRFSIAGIRTSLFMDTAEEGIRAAAITGTDRIELYTEDYAVKHKTMGEDAAIPYARAATLAHELGMGVNAGHDLDLSNLRDFANNVPYLDEVSIGHALISDALYVGLSNTVAKYLACLS